MALWIIFAAMTAAAFTLLLRPFKDSEKKNSQAHLEVDVYKDQLGELEKDVEEGLVRADEAEAAKTEISRRLLEASSGAPSSPHQQGETAAHKKTVIALLILVPVVSLSVYLLVGQPNYQNVIKKQPTAEQLSKEQTLNVLTQRVEAHLKKNPDDLKGWLVLARTYSNMGRETDAIRAFDNINRLRKRAGDIAQLPPAQRELMIRAMVASLHQKLKQDGSNLQGWQKLMRAYVVLGEMREARASYLEARKAFMDDGQALKSLSSSALQMGILKEKSQK